MMNNSDHLKAQAALRTDDGASWSVGDEVLYVILNGETRAMTQGVFRLLEKSLDLAQREGRSLVLSHEGSDFNAGEDWPLLYGLSIEGRYSELEQYLNQCYQLLGDIRSSEVPFVLLAEGKCLGMASRFIHLADRCILGPQFSFGFEGTVLGLAPTMGSLVDFPFAIQDKKGSELRKSTLAKFEKILFAKLFREKSDLALSMAHNSVSPSISWISDPKAREKVAMQEGQWLARSVLPKAKPNPQVWVGGMKGWSCLAHQIYLWASLGQLDPCRRDLALDMAHLVSGLGVSAEGHVPRLLLLEAEKSLFMKQIRNQDVLARLGQALGAH